ncbi:MULTISPECIES: hypothetical protein [unclassified Streptococcus]|uniref:hypothetical protein n=1 Tax=unclassified Streptococcus TaxID=2608887 RepID=UPI001D169E56|nr:MULTISPECIES: hypothetical protein [unclassified Streptococcus]
MIKLIYYQFMQNKMQWVGILPLIFISSLIIGLSINGSINMDLNAKLFSGLPDPKPIFSFPIVFGGITLFFVLSTLISLLVEMFRTDYILLETLGANRFHISFLVGSQISIISLTISFISYIFSIPFTQGYYYFLQYFFGENLLPDVHFSLSFIGLVVTVFLTSLIVFLSGFYYTMKEMGPKSTSEIKIFKKIILMILIGVSWSLILIKIFENPSISIRTQMLFYLTIFNIAIIYQISPYIQSLFLRLISSLFIRDKYMYIISKWNLLFNRRYVKSVSAAIISIITLITSFQLISQNILYKTQEDANLELIVSLIVYMGAPILIVFANIISIALLSMNKEKTDIQNIEILGASRSQLVLIKLGEATLLTIIISTISLIINLLFCFLLVIFINDMSLKSLNYTGLY